MNINEKFAELKTVLEEGTIDYLIPFFFMLQVDDKPFSLKNHFQFEQVYKLNRPKQLCLMCARQVGKTFSICSSNLLLSWLIKGYRSLFVLPRAEQAKRLSNDCMRLLINTSPFKPSFIDSGCDETVLFRSFKNNSVQYFQYAFLDPDRIRGIASIHDLFYDEVQDMNSDFMPVIDEVTSAVERWGFKNFSGTPKTLDNTLASLFEDSSQAEWVTKCEHCNKFNIPSIDEDLLEMIGKSTCVCAKCKKPLDCANGTFVHRFPKRRQMFSGYHVSQITHPLHYRNKEKWIDIIYKMRTYPKAKLYNEILGTPCDFADKLLSQGELQSACSNTEKDKNDLTLALQKTRELNFRVMGIDWGGGGDESASYTAIALGGTRPGQEAIEIIYGTKLNRNMPSWDQAKYILELYKKFNPNFVAHDYGGAGVDKETILIQAGMPMEKLVPFTYVMSSQKPIIYYNPPEKGYRYSYSLDKMRSIVVLAHMIKAHKIKFPTWESMTDIDTGLDIITLLEDFLHINAERFERPRGSDVILITKSPKKSDDFVHAVNYLCSCVWYTQQRYPNIAEAANMQLTAEEVAEFHPKQLHDI
jgi:hypothetical protein